MASDRRLAVGRTADQTLDRVQLRTTTTCGRVVRVLVVLAEQTAVVVVLVLIVVLAEAVVADVAADVGAEVGLLRRLHRTEIERIAEGALHRSRRAVAQQVVTYVRLVVRVALLERRRFGREDDRRLLGQLNAGQGRAREFGHL